jgi:hypothetical protein
VEDQLGQGERPDGHIPRQRSHRVPALLWLSDSRQTLNVKPEQSPPSPPVAGSSRGSFGESSRSLSFQHPPGHFSSCPRGPERFTALRPSRLSSAL